MSALVLLSGGMDSTTLLAKVANEEVRVHALTLDYGSTHSFNERYAAKLVCEHYGIPHHEGSIPKWWFQGGSSALLEEAPMPHKTYKELEDEQGPSVTVVPFRNAVFLSVAVAMANARGLERVFFAGHATDHGSWAYPDCSPEFVGAFGAAAYIGTYHATRLVAPFLHYTKTDIVREAATLLAPLHLTWSCYSPIMSTDYGHIETGHLDSKPKMVHCGECPTCIERLAAFASAGYDDPVDYAIALEQKGPEKPWPTK